MLNFDREIIITTGSSRKSTVWKPQKMLWSEFVDKIKSPVRGTETLSEYLGMPKSKQDDLKDVGGFVGGTFKDTHRKAENVTGRDLITLDLDNIPTGGTVSVLQRLSSLGCGYVVYSTRKHEEVKPRLRAVFLLDRTCTADEYEPIARKLAQFIGIEFCDPTTFQASRLMYWPSASADSQYIYYFEDKPILSVDGMLSQYGDWHDFRQWPEVPGAQQVPLRLAKKQGDPTEKAGVVGAFCRTYNIYTAIERFIPDIYTPCGEGRYTYADGSTSGGAVIYEDGKFLYSHHATDPCGGRLCNAFDLIRIHKYGELDDEVKEGTPTCKLPSYVEMCRLAVADTAVSALLNKERYDKATSEFNQPPEETADWMSMLQISPQSGAVAKTTDNVYIILTHDPLLRDKIIFDEFSGLVLTVGSLPWNDKSSERRRWNDTDDAGLRRYLEKTYAITGKDRILDALALAVQDKAVDELKEYLTSVQWDGVGRLESFFIDYLGAEDTPYVRTCTRKFFVAAVARVFCPGCKFDNMPILGGPQGIGKSTAIRKMGLKWYSDSLDTFEGKEASEMLRGVWINEIGELSGMNTAELNSVKRFLTKVEDIYREPFGRRTCSFPRRNVFIGSTNDREYLRDRTGNRRFWPIDCAVNKPTKNVFTQLDYEVPLLWEEAVEYYQLGETLYLPPDIEKCAEAAQQAHMETNSREGVIRDFVARLVPADWNKRTLSQRRAYWANEFGQSETDIELVSRDKICALEIWCEALGGDIKLMRKSDTREINDILSSIKEFKKSDKPLRFIRDYGLQRGYIAVTF